jgi:hypothetical protein
MYVFVTHSDSQIIQLTKAEAQDVKPSIATTLLQPLLPGRPNPLVLSGRADDVAVG